MTVLLMTRPSDREDPRFRLPRSPECPNDAPAKIVEQGLAGTCGQCAWGFYTEDSPFPGRGEPADTLTLEPVLKDGSSEQLGYRARCGKVNVFRDQHGRVGAVRKIAGQERFFPALEGNWAAERYAERHPELKAAS